MDVGSFIFLLVAVPILFCVATWVVGTVYRVYFPEKDMPVDDRPDRAPRRRPARDVPIPIGAREIRQNQRATPISGYSFENGLSRGLPAVWLEDMWQRRN